MLRMTKRPPVGAKIVTGVFFWHAPDNRWVCVHEYNDRWTKRREAVAHVKRHGWKAEMFVKAWYLVLCGEQVLFAQRGPEVEPASLSPRAQL